MNIIIALIISLSAFLGQGQAPTSEPQTVAHVNAYSVTDTEATVLQNDAVATWSDYMEEPMTGEDVAYTWVGSYTFEPDELPADVVVLQSIDLDRTWHTYKAQLLAHA